jgi:hypothetical protein
MTTREQIKEKIIVNGKLCHWCVNESWFDKKDIKYILDAIFLETKFLDSVASLRERIFYIQLDLYAAMLCPVCKNQVRINSSGFPYALKKCGTKGQLRKKKKLKQKYL